MTDREAKIRQAEAGDETYFVAAVQALHRHEHQDIDLPIREDLPARLASWFQRLINDTASLLLIADDGDGQPAGFILGAIHIQPNDFTVFSFHGMVHLVWVEPGYRSQGLGRALLGIMEQCLKEQGAPYIEVQFALNNPSAETFWTRAGYVAYGVQARKFLVEETEKKSVQETLQATPQTSAPAS